MAKKIFVLNGHPREASLSATFAQTYADAAQGEGHEVRVMNVGDLEGVLQSIEWADHVVLTSPMWWGGLPAKLKGLIDRSFLPGRTFDTKSGKFPKPMLKGRTARVIRKRPV